MLHKFTNHTASTLLVDRDIRDPDAQTFLVVDRDKNTLDDLTKEEIRILRKAYETPHDLSAEEAQTLKSLRDPSRKIKLPRIKTPTGGADPKAPTELYLNSSARGCGFPEPFPGYRNDYKFPEKRIENAAKDRRLRDYIGHDDILRAAEAVTRWRDGSSPTDEVLQVLAASEVGEEGGILALWTDLSPIYESHGNDNKRSGGTHMHRWHLCSRPLSTASVSHPEIMTSAWVSVADLVEVIRIQRGDQAQYLDMHPEFQRIKNALWENASYPHAEFIEGVVYGHGEALMHAFSGNGKPKTVCRMKNMTCV